MSEKRERPVRTKHRRKPARMKVVNGRLVILCPFCEEDHPIDIQNPAPCGTILHVSAVQEVWKNATCALCGTSDDRPLVKIGSQYRHVENCSPGKRLYVVPPKPSFSAKMFYFSPKWVQYAIAKTFGKVPTRLERAGIIKYAWEKPDIIAP